LNFLLKGKDKGKGKGKVRPRTGHEGPKGEKIKLYSFFNLGVSWDGWSTPRPGCFTPGKDPVPTVREDGWAIGPIWTVAENLAPTGIRPPDRPARTELLVVAIFVSTDH